MTSALKIYIGYDPREHDAYLVARNSIEKNTSSPVLISPLTLASVKHLIPPPLKIDGRYWDLDSDAPQSTEFARSRFCIPYLTNGWALFMDSDMLCVGDIQELFDLRDDRYAVQVVKHSYTPQESVKMDGQVQTEYPRKNWSSVVLWNCNHEAHLRLPKFRLQQWPGRRLHGFEWLQDDEIGELPSEWNVLVDVNNVENPKLLHFTLGNPDMPGYENCTYADLWWKEYEATARANVRRSAGSANTYSA